MMRRGRLRAHPPALRPAGKQLAAWSPVIRFLHGSCWRLYVVRACCASLIARCGDDACTAVIMGPRPDVVRAGFGVCAWQQSRMVHPFIFFAV